MEPLLSLPASSDEGKLNVAVFPDRVELLWKGFLTTTGKAILAAATNGLSYAVTGRTGDKELETLPLGELLEITATRRLFFTRLAIKTPSKTIRIDLSRKEGQKLEELLDQLIESSKTPSNPVKPDEAAAGHFTSSKDRSSSEEPAEPSFEGVVSAYEAGVLTFDEFLAAKNKALDQ